PPSLEPWRGHGSHFITPVPVLLGALGALFLRRLRGDLRAGRAPGLPPSPGRWVGRPRGPRSNRSVPALLSPSTPFARQDIAAEQCEFRCFPEEEEVHGQGHGRRHGHAATA